MRCGKKQCYLESLWTFRYNKDIASEKTLKSGEKKGVTMDIIAKISEELGIRKNQAEAAVKLIKKGKAYVSDLSAEQIREYRGSRKADR